MLGWRDTYIQGKALHLRDHNQWVISECTGAWWAMALEGSRKQFSIRMEQRWETHFQKFTWSRTHYYISAHMLTWGEGCWSSQGSSLHALWCTGASLSRFWFPASFWIQWACPGKEHHGEELALPMCQPGIGTECFMPGVNNNSNSVISYSSNSDGLKTLKGRCILSSKHASWLLN